MRLPFLRLSPVIVFLCLAAGIKDGTEKPQQRSSLWGKVTSPVRGLYRRGKKAIASTRKVVFRSKRRAVDTGKPQEKTVEALVEELDKVGGETETESEIERVDIDPSDATDKAATIAEGTAASLLEEIAEKASSATVSSKLGEDGSSGAASEGANAAVVVPIEVHETDDRAPEATQAPLVEEAEEAEEAVGQVQSKTTAVVDGANEAAGVREADVAATEL